MTDDAAQSYYHIYLDPTRSRNVASVKALSSSQQREREPNLVIETQSHVQSPRSHLCAIYLVIGDLSPRFFLRGVVSWPARLKTSWLSEPVEEIAMSLAPDAAQ